MKQQKHLALLLGCSLVLTTCIMPAPKASAAKIKLNKKKLSLQVKQSYTLKLKNCKKKIKWSSSKKKIASVTSNGKVKAKKAGKTTITAKVGKKKYTCKVTVKKASITKVSPAPKNTKAPQPSSTAQVPGTSNTPSPGPNSSSAPELSPEELAKHVSIKRQIFPEHIILTVSNNNSVWLDSVIVNYEYYGLNNTSIASGYEELSWLKPGESQCIAVPTITGEAIDNLDTEASSESIEVTAPNQAGIYSDQSDKLEIQEEEVDYNTASLTLNLKNHSPLMLKGSYIIYFYDANNTLLDAACSIINLDRKEQQNEYIDIPAQSTNYQIQQYSAHSFEEIDDNTMLEKGISAVAEKLTDCLLVTVTNANSQWLSSVDLDYEFYDAEDNFLSTNSNHLLSMGPGEVQYLTIEADSDEIEKINLDYSIANISIERAASNAQYQNTSLVTASIESNRDIEDNEEEVEDNTSYTITFTNGAALPIDGSYIIYFRNNAGNIITARQDTLSIAANDSYPVTLDIPVLYDQNDNEIPLASLQITDIQIFAHTYTQNGENQ